MSTIRRVLLTAARSWTQADTLHSDGMPTTLKAVGKGTRMLLQAGTRRAGCTLKAARMQVSRLLEGDPHDQLMFVLHIWLLAAALCMIRAL